MEGEELDWVIRYFVPLGISASRAASNCRTRWDGGAGDSWERGMPVGCVVVLAWYTLGHRPVDSAGCVESQESWFSKERRWKKKKKNFCKVRIGKNCLGRGVSAKDWMDNDSRPKSGRKKEEKVLVRYGLL